MEGDKNDFIRRLKKGSPRAYKELFDRFFMKSYCIAYSYVVDMDTAKDIAQEVFISIFDHSQKLEGINNLSSYISISVRNRCLNYLRDLDLEDKNKRLYWESTINSLPDDGNEEVADMLSRIERELPSLPESCRIICEMRFSKGMKIKDIAEKLHLAESTVKVQIHRAVSKIRERLAKK